MIAILGNSIVEDRSALPSGHSFIYIFFLACDGCGAPPGQMAFWPLTPRSDRQEASLHTGLTQCRGAATM